MAGAHPEHHQPEADDDLHAYRASHALRVGQRSLELLSSLGTKRGVPGDGPPFAAQEPKSVLQLEITKLRSTPRGAVQPATYGHAMNERSAPTELRLYLPADPLRGVLCALAPGTAIVGGALKAPAGFIAVDYEGNLYGAETLERYADRAVNAAGRHTANCPTVARAWAKASELIPIGYIDTATGEVALDGPDERRRLAEWLGVGELETKELEASGARYAIRREVLAARASGDPARRAQADWFARHHRLDV